MRVNYSSNHHLDIVPDKWGCAGFAPGSVNTNLVMCSSLRFKRIRMMGFLEPNQDLPHPVIYNLNMELKNKPV